MKPNNMWIFDLDGTLDLTDIKLSLEIIKMSREGISFVTATGRTNSYVKETCKKNNIMQPRFIIADNGGTIYDNVNQEYIKRTILPLESRKKILEEYIRLGGKPEDIRCTDGENVYASEDEDVKKYYENETIIEYKEASKLLSAAMSDEAEITKITLAGKIELMQKIDEFIKQNGIKCWTDIGATKFPRKGIKNYRLDITGGETSKGEATEFLTNYTGIKNFTCIGNGPNDLSMFEYALDCGMKVIVVRNYEEGKVTSESEELIKKVKAYAEKIGQINNVIISEFPINEYIEKRKMGRAYKRQIFKEGLKVKGLEKINVQRESN